MKVKEESEKAGLKHNIQKTKIMASGPVTSWQIDGEMVETATDFIVFSSKITADGDCSHEIKRRQLLVGCRLWGRTESNMTEVTQQQQQAYHSISFKEKASFNFMAAVTIYSDFGAPKVKSLTVSIVSPSICHEMMRLDAMMLVS